MNSSLFGLPAMQDAQTAPRPSNQPCCVLLLPPEPGASNTKLPCGHVYCPAGMAHLITTLLDDPNRPFMLRCCGGLSGCGAAIDWDTALDIAASELSPEQTAEAIGKITFNYAVSALHAVECPYPGCGALRIRPDNERHMLVMTCRLGHPQYSFCCLCRRPWRSADFRSRWCGNAECADELKSIVEILTECSRSTTAGCHTGLPSQRCCPRCLSLCHSEGCKMRQCRICGTWFCWVCLQVQKGTRYPCGDESGVCTGKRIEVQTLEQLKAVRLASFLGL